ncbi:hypothetical protein KI387_026065, partial [Taxus chinensis]
MAEKSNKFVGRSRKPMETLNKFVINYEFQGIIPPNSIKLAYDNITDTDLGHINVQQFCDQLSFKNNSHHFRRFNDAFTFRVIQNLNQNTEERFSKEAMDDMYAPTINFSSASMECYIKLKNMFENAQSKMVNLNDMPGMILELQCSSSDYLLAHVVHLAPIDAKIIQKYSDEVPNVFSGLLIGCPNRTCDEKIRIVTEEKNEWVPTTIDLSNIMSLSGYSFSHGTTRVISIGVKRIEMYRLTISFQIISPTRRIMITAVDVPNHAEGECIIESSKMVRAIFETELRGITDDGGPIHKLFLGKDDTDKLIHPWVENPSRGGNYLSTIRDYRERQLDKEEGEEEERAKRVRFCQRFESIERQNNVNSGRFDFEFDHASNSPFIGEIFEEWTEVRVKDSLEGKETAKHAPDGKDKASSSNLFGSAHVLFARSLEPEETRHIDGSEFSLMLDHEIEVKKTLSERDVFERDLVQSVWDAWRQRDVEAMDKILATSCEEILKNPFNPNQYHCINCAYISKKMPEAFSLPETFKVLLKLLSSGLSKSLTDNSNLLPIFACKLLYPAFVRELEWPIEFIQAFLGDIVGPCAWIEHDSCKDFVGILSAAFQESIITPKNRYSNDMMCKMVRREYFTVLGEVLKANSTRENPRVLLKLLLIGAEYDDARLIASSMLEHWINNPIHMHTAKALLHGVVQKTCSMSKSDKSTVGNLFLLKIKDQCSNIYHEMVTQLVCKRAEYAVIALKTLVLVALSVKDISNLKSISTVLSAISVTASPEHELAMILQELAANDNARTRLKEFVCRLVRHMGSEINIKALCQGLLQQWDAMANQSESLKLAWLTEIAELVTVSLVHSTTVLAMDESIMVIVSLPENSESSILKAANILHNTRKEKLEALGKVRNDLTMFQLEAMAWCTDVVVVYAPNMNEDQFANILKKFLFLGEFQSFFQRGEGVGEIEQNSLQLLGFCTRASEEVLARVILLGISDLYPLTMGDALSIIESLVWRAAMFENIFRGGLHAESNQLPAAVIKLASFCLPGLPQQSLPHLVYKDKYWRACMVLLLIAVYNPRTIGQYLWEHNATVRQMMEMVITGSQKFLALDDETAGKLESDDAKAEESIYSALLNSKHANRTVLGELLLDTYEWRGNVALLNTSGALGRLPESIIEELEEADNVYQFGHVLRQCRSPDFFAQITQLQKLSKSWGWLRRILCREPELVSVLPFLWQCELLYLQEGLVACGGKHFVDSKKLYLTVCKVVTNKSHEKEVKDFVEHISHKLADKSSLIRRQARRFFTHIFNTSFEFSNESSLSRGSGQKHFATRNTVFDYCNLEREYPLRKITKNSVPDDYDLGWLEGIDTHPNAHAILGSLLPAIQNAVLVETTFDVVSVYLKFLEKYSPPFPSLLSLSCTIARLLVQRKEFASCFILREKEGTSISGQDINMTEFILNALYEALGVGTFCQLNDEKLVGIKSPLVTLVAPLNGGGGTMCLRRITLHKIVLDAILLVLSLPVDGENNGKNENAIIERMIEFLLPNVGGKTSVAWLESKMGKNLPLLSEDQAIAFSRSKDERIAFAGYNALSIKAILQLCEGLGIPLVAVDYILGVLDSTAGLRIQELSEKTKEQKVGILQACLQTLSKFTNKCCPNLSRILPQLSSDSMLFMTHKPGVLPGSMFINSNEDKYDWASTADIIDSTIGQMITSDLSFHHGLLGGVPDLIFAYGELRKCIQREICCDNTFSFLHTMEIYVKRFKVFEGHGFSWVHLCFILLPSLTVLVSSTYGTLENFRTFPFPETHSEWKLQIGCHGPLQRLLIEMETELARNSDNLSRDENISEKVRHARFVMAELQHVVEEGYVRSHSSCQESVFKTMNVNYQESCSHLDSSYVPFLGVEGSLCTFLELNFKQVWSERWLKYNPDIFISELLQFVFTTIRKGGDFLNCTSNLEDDTLGNGKCVMLSGCLGLFSGFLKFMDLFMNSHVWTSFLFSTENDGDVLPPGPEQSFMQLCFTNIVNESSWQVVVKLLNSMLEYFGRITPIACGLKKQVEVIAMLEFLDMCSFHPQTVLVHCLSAQLENQVPGKKIKVPLTRPLSAHCLVNISLQACANIQMIGSLQCSLQEKSSIDKVLHEDVDSLARILLVSSAAKSENNLHTILENLLSLDCDNECDKMTDQASSMRDVLSNVVKELLWTIYFAFPFSVDGALQFDRDNMFFTNKMLNGFKILQSRKLLFYRCRQALPMYPMVQNCLKIICEGKEKQSDMAYGFCHHLAKKHPVLVLPHLLTLAALLKEKMSGMTQGEDHICSFGHALYLVAGLLDALRPHILDWHYSEHLNDVRCCLLKDSIAERTTDVQKRQDFSKGNLEVIMDVYFEVLNNLQVVNLPQYLKVVIRLTDFLCHCVATGKQCWEIVARHREVIEAMAKKFSKIKKLGFLLSLVENPGLSLHSPRTDTQLLKSESHIEDFPFGPPLLPVDVVLKVQNQLQRFLSLQTYDSDNNSTSRGEPEAILHRQGNSKSSNLEDENDLISVLEDVEKASARVPTLLSSLEGFLIELTKVQNKDVQMRIYQLLERLLLHCPSKYSSGKVIKAVLLNLKSSDTSVAKLAAQQAVKIFCHCP